MSMLQQKPRTLLHHLSWMAETKLDRHAFSFLKDDITEFQRLTFTELNHRARAVGAALQDRCTRGDRVILLFPPGLDFVSALLGCLYAGVVAVPIPSPDVVGHFRCRLQLRAIAQDSQASLLLTTSRLLKPEMNGAQGSINELNIPWMALENIDVTQSECYRELSIQGQDLAYLQYTSGSTSAPKGVMITHDNVMFQCEEGAQAANYDDDCISINWMPHFHDYGLVQGVLMPLFAGIPAFLMSPFTFLKRPIVWLEAISQFSGTHSGGPNFAYEYCVRKTSVAQRSSLNLRSWRMASCGAEPIRKETVEKFIASFQPYGFRPEAFHPGYGLAECTLMVSVKSQFDVPRWEELNGKALGMGTILAASSHDLSSPRTIVGCGRVSPNTRIEIVNPHTQVPCVPLEIGEIWVASPSVARGYWSRPEDTKETFGACLAGTGKGPYLRTGDLGFLKGGELFVAGRLKELIIIHGMNHYPQDIEQTVEHSHESFRLGRSAAISVDVEGDERLVVVQEMNAESGAFVIEELAGLVRQNVMLRHDLPVHEMVLVKTGSLPTTSSGKIQRYACRAAYLRGTLAIIGRSMLNLALLEGREPGSQHHDLRDFPRQERKKCLESYLCQQLARTLKVDLDHFPQTHSLGAWGLDSLMAVEVLTQIERDLGVEIPLSGILKASNISELAQIIDQAYHLGAKIPKKCLVSPSRPSSVPLSFSQEGFWISNELDPENPLNIIHFQIKLTGTLNVEALGKAINNIVNRHESLRTTFQDFKGQLVQIISPNITIPVPLIDLRDLEPAQRKEELEELIRDGGCQPFNLQEGPLFRVMLVQMRRHEYVLLLSFHHIVCDWWSVGVFLKELSLLYRASTEFGDQEITALPIQYPDYAIWQRQCLQGEEFHRLRSYWKKILSNVPTKIDFPTRAIKVRDVPTHQRAGSFSLSTQQIKALKDLSQEEGATLFMTLVAAFFVLLFRYTHQTDLVIGTPAANRARQGVDALIGIFMNPLVLRVDMTGNPTFREILQRVRVVALEAYDHQEFPFELLVKELQPVRDESRNPLFQVLFEVQVALDDHLDLPGLTSQVLGSDIPGTQFDLTVSLLENDGEIDGVFEYNTDVFDEGLVQQMVEHFSMLLEAVTVNPDQRITTHSLLSKSQEHQILSVWSGAETRKPEFPCACIHELFERQVAQTPDAIAVVHQEDRLTYADLNRWANQFARYLQRLGVGPESLVGLCLGRGLELVVSILGILKAGGAYVPLDPRDPKERVRRILHDAKMPVILTQSWVEFEFASHTNHIVILDRDWEKIGQLETSNLPTSTVPENVAYVLYTSGSTGTPKGVMGTHGGVVQAYQGWEQAYKLRTISRNHLQLANVIFDVFLEDLVRALCSGGKLVVCPEDLALSPQLLDLMKRECIDFVEMVPTTMRHVIRYLEEWKMRLDQIKYWVVGADSWHMEEFSRLREFSRPDTRIVNSYGVTEVTVDSTYCEDVPYELELYRPVPIGKPILNTTVYILDKDLLPVSPGVIGELFIGGSGVARGYLNRPELTAERFIPNPFSTERGSRLYKTGDFARFLFDGTIEFLGRRDHQVKINGMRIELGEVEHEFRQHPGVKECVVEVRKDKFENDNLVSYVVTKEDVLTPTPQDFRKFLNDKLPHFMIPSAFVFLDHLPLTLSGKVDRLALPVPEDSRHLDETRYIAPRTAMERTLVRIWEDVLEVSPIGVQDDFFDLGGYSILAVDVMYQIETLTGRTLPLATLFQARTIESLVEVLIGEKASPPIKTLVPIQPAGNKPPLFFVHLVGGNVLSFAELSKVIDQEQPLYGLQSIGLDGRDKPIDNIEKMAARYVEEIQLFQPRGPYFLAGGCMGGVVAFEMAQQFRAKGQRVAFLGMVDSWLPDLGETNSKWDFEPGPRVAYLIRALKSQMPILKETPIYEWFGYGVRKLKVLAQIAGTLDVYRGNRAARNHDMVLHANQRAFSKYWPKSYGGRISYFLASARSVPFKKDPRLKWEKYARGGLKIFRIPAPNAGQMFTDPYVGLLGTQLKRALQQAQSEAGKEVGSW